MRKWIAGLLVLTALTPVMASAQEMQDRPQRGQRGGGQGGARAEVRVDGSDDDRRGSRAAPAQDTRVDRGSPDDAIDPVGRGRPQADRGARGGDGDRGPADRPRAPGGWQDRDGPDRRRDDAPDRGVWRQSPDRGGNGGVQQRPDRGPGDDRSRSDRGPAGGFQQRDDRGRRDPRRDGWNGSRFDDRDDGWTRSRFDDRGRGNGSWNRGWRNDTRYDWNRYRNGNRDAFRLPRYYAPYGWSGGYRRFSIGVGLSASLWNRSYWIADPYAYRLPEAYGPYRWVRYYDDALLVDLRSGVVVDAAYGIFW